LRGMGPEGEKDADGVAGGVEGEEGGAREEEEEEEGEEEGGGGRRRRKERRRKEKSMKARRELTPWRREARREWTRWRRRRPWAARGRIRDDRDARAGATECWAAPGASSSLLLEDPQSRPLCPAHWPPRGTPLPLGAPQHFR